MTQPLSSNRFLKGRRSCFLFLFKVEVNLSALLFVISAVAIYTLPVGVVHFFLGIPNGGKKRSWNCLKVACSFPNYGNCFPYLVK